MSLTLKIKIPSSVVASSPTNVVDVWNNCQTTYTCDKSLQQGYSGDVFLGRETTVDEEGNESTSPVVFKIFKKRQHFEAELNALTSVFGHPNIVTIRTETNTDKSMWDGFPVSITDANILILDYYAGGDLLEYVHARGNVYRGVVSLLQFRKMCKSLLHGLIHCQEHGIYHRDIKLENIFLRSDDPTKLVIGDFGLASNTPRGIECCGTLGYMSPEAVAQGFDENGYDHELSDVWSLGVLLFSLIFVARPYEEPVARGERWCQKLVNGKWETNDWLQALCKQQYKLFWMSHYRTGRNKNVYSSRLWGNDKKYPYMKDLRNFFEDMFAPIGQRKTFAELLTHPFLSGNKMEKKSGFKRTRSTSTGWTHPSDLPRCDNQKAEK